MRKTFFGDLIEQKVQKKINRMPHKSVKTTNSLLVSRLVRTAHCMEFEKKN